MLGKNIKQYLKDNGISQKWLSSKIKMPQNILSITLNEKRRLEAEEFLSICDALSVSPDKFKKFNEIKNAS